MRAANLASQDSRLQSHRICDKVTNNANLFLADGKGQRTGHREIACDSGKSDEATMGLLEPIIDYDVIWQ